MAQMRASLIFLLAFLCAAHGVEGGEYPENRYAVAESVIIWASEVGPSADISDTRDLFELPYCGPATRVERDFTNIGEMLSGHSMVDWGLRVGFKNDVPVTRMCHSSVFRNEQKALLDAILNDWVFQLYVDGLSVRGRVGLVSPEERARGRGGNYSAAEPIDAYILTQFDFEMHFNGDQVVAVVLSQKAPMRYDAGEIHFSYSVTWIASTTPFAMRNLASVPERLRRNGDARLTSKVHWISIVNVSLLLILLVATVSTILARTVTRDHDRYANAERGVLGDGSGSSALEDEGTTAAIMHDDIMDSGWREVGADVFLRPDGAQVLAILYGAGMQVNAVIVASLASALLGRLHATRGLLLSVVITEYCVLSCVGGYFSGGLLARFDECTPTLGQSKAALGVRKIRGRQLAAYILVCAACFPAICLAIALLSKALLKKHGTGRFAAPLPYGALYKVATQWWVPISLPLTAIGFMAGRALLSPWSASWHTNPIPRPIPRTHALKSPPALALASGALCFGALATETHYALSLSTHSAHHATILALAIYALVTAITACSAIVVTYTLLSASNHRWAPTAYASGASTGLFCGAYCAAHLALFPATAAAAAGAAVACVAVALACGSVAFGAASWFVLRLYRAGDKAD